MIFAEDDIRAALKEALPRFNPFDEQVTTVADAAEAVTQGLIARWHSARPQGIRDIGAMLNTIEAQCAAATFPVVGELRPPPPEGRTSETLSHELRLSQSPLVIALLDASQKPDHREIDPQPLAHALLAVDQLREWANAAKRQ